MNKADYEFFENNFKQLYDKYAGQYLVIKDAAIIDNYDTFEDALYKTLETYELGTFSIQHCVKGNDDKPRALYLNNFRFAEG